MIREVLRQAIAIATTKNDYVYDYEWVLIPIVRLALLNCLPVLVGIAIPGPGVRMRQEA